MKNIILCILSVICVFVLITRFAKWKTGGEEEPVPTSELLEALHAEKVSIDDTDKDPDEAWLPPSRIGSRFQKVADPKSPETREKIIRLGLKHKPDATIEECLEILRQDPTNFHALTHISLAYFGSGRSRDALIFASRALEVKNDEPTRDLLAKIYEAQGKPDQAERVRQSQ